MVDDLQVLAHHAEVTKANLEFDPKQIRNIIQILIDNIYQIDDLKKSLEMTATGSIVNEPKNYKDTVNVMRQIAKEAILRKAQEK